MKVTVYVEGGGDRKDLKSRCREGFRRFFEKAGFLGRMPTVVACGGREAAYDHFLTAVRCAQDDEFQMLLVDSEGPVPAGTAPSAFLKEHDHWAVAESNDAAQLMVQCMETWFLVDPDALSRYFEAKVRPPRKDVEHIPKADVMKAMKAAAGKDGYHKGEHSFKILARIDPQKVRAAAPHCDRLLKALERRLSQ